MAKLDLLKGMKVIDMASFVAGPTCAKILAEYGADVIRIEALVGDDKTRDVGKNAMGIKNGDLVLYDLVNGNKKQLALDTRRPEGLAILKKLLETADVFVCHLRQNNMERLGLDWENLHKTYPGLIYANVTGYGTKGPYADRGGFDSVAYVSRAGVHTGAEREGTKPYMPYAGQGDIPTGSYLAMGVMAAYINKLRTGKGEMVTANLYGAGIWAGAFPIITAQEPYNVPWPKDPMDTFSPLYNIYQCADGHWVTICGNGWEVPWPKFIHYAGWDEEWLTKYPHMVDAYMNGRKLSEEMARWMATKNYDEVDDILSKSDIPHDVCQSYREVAQDPVAFEADLMQEIHYPRSGSTVRIPRSPVHFHEAGLPETVSAGVPGEDTMDVLTSYGFSEEEIRKLADEKIVGLGDTWTPDYLVVKR